MPLKDQILTQLKQIIDPDLNQDIVSLGFIKNLKTEEGVVSFDIALTTPACPIKGEFQRQAEEIVKKISGVQSVNVTMTSQPRKVAPTPQEQNSGLKDVRSIIAVSSCKGGVGKSTVAAHMAQELARRGYKVGIIDADIHGPSIPSLFQLHNVDVRANAQKQFIPAEKNGLKIISFGFLLGDAPAVMRGPIVTRYIQQLIHNTAWGELDYLFVDMPPGTGDVQLTITQSVRLSGAVIVTTRQTLSLIDVSRGILMFEKVNVPLLGIIENMSYFICDACDKKHYIFGESKCGDLHERFGLDILGELPILKHFSSSPVQPLANDYIMTLVDNTVRSLGKAAVLEKQVPDIQFDSKQITLKWPAGEQISVSNRALRLGCKCAVCVDEISGKQLIRAADIKSDIQAENVFPLGNYAIGIYWNDGHSSGIYPYAMIKDMVNKDQALNANT